MLAELGSEIGKRPESEAPPIIFLEIDGVLHTDETYLSQGSLAYMGPGHFCEYAPLLEQLIAPYPELRLVLSTSWLTTVGFEPALQALPPLLRARVIDATCTPKLSLRSRTRLLRWEEILDYVDRHAITRWLVLDSAYDSSWPQRYLDHLVHTHHQLCLGEQRVQSELAAKLKEMMSEMTLGALDSFVTVRR